MRSRSKIPGLLILLLLVGDASFAFAGLAIGYWLRFGTSLREIGISDSVVTFGTYLPLLLTGTSFLVATYAYLHAYNVRILLRPNRTLLIIGQSTLFWFVAFLGTSLALKFQPPMSRLFVSLSCVTTTVTVALWRTVIHKLLQASRVRDRLLQRVALVGWSREAEQLADAIRSDPNHPYEVIGYIPTNATPRVDYKSRFGCVALGSLSDFEQIVGREHIDIAIVCDASIPAESLLEISGQCERLYVQFKIVPSYFRIFVSSLRLQAISNIPVLGVDELRITSPLNAAVKRLIDIGGGLVGLLISLPIMAGLAILIRRESSGPVIYRQRRTGRHGHPFTIFKMRSMRTDAEAHGPRWATADDPRRLTVGAFMRRWNLDELPQFWNVLRGDMSLVGPRPERPELIAKFESEIPHYNPRHEVRPGMTGWAQVNGLRGNTSLVDRIKYDLYYIENWSLWFDLQILLLTFVRNQNAY